MEGVIIDRVLGVGTTNEDTLGFVQCTFNDGDTRAIAFTPELASIVATAFLAASGHLEQKQQMRRDETRTYSVSKALAVADAEIAFGRRPNDPDEIVLTLLTRAGASVSVSLPPRVMQKITDGFRKILEALEGFAPPSSH
ncbi:MAG TPA: hypothetical protein VNH44_12745 [Micropepsaceae bacterium]|nr:hypothetical protein [Micropepsaceae bacterium]